MFLQSMREKTQSWVAYVIVGLLILSFALWGISSYFGGNDQNEAIAKVAGEKITAAEFTSAYRQFLQNNQNPRFTSEQELLAKKTVLRAMIERLAIMRYLTNVGFAVNQEQIDAALMSVPLFSENGEFSPARFKRFLMVNSISAQKFIADFATRMTMAQWDEGIRMSSFSTPTELSRIVSLLKQKRTIVYAIVRSNKKDLYRPTDSELAAYYKDHENDYITPEQVKISYVALYFDNVLKSIHPTQQALLTYYTQNITRYTVPESWKVNIIAVQSASSPVDIAHQVAKAVSTPHGLDTVTGARLQNKAVWLTGSTLSSEIKAVLTKTKVNETTTAFQTGPNQYIIYQLLAYQEPVTKSFASVQKDVEKAYINEQANKKWSEMLEKMADLSYEHPDALTSLVHEFNLPVSSSSFFSQDYDGNVGIESNAEVIAAAFSNDVLTGGNNSDVIKLKKGKIALVLRVADTIPAQQKTFNKVKSLIETSLKNEHAILKAKETADNIKLALESGQSIDFIQKKYGVIFSTLSVGRFSQTVPNEVLQQAFVLSVNQASVAKYDQSDFSVVKLLSIVPGKISSVSQKDQVIYQNVIVNEWAQAELLAYVRSIVDDASVKVYDKSLNEQ